MIYRILHDESYLMHVIPPVESMAKLGEEHGTFAFNAEPKPYQEVWKPLEIEFRPCEGSKATEVPDVSENFGRLFLSERAFSVLGELLEQNGECLPVTFGGRKGYIFNPTATAEQHDAAIQSVIAYDEHGNLAHFAFDEERLASVSVFKTNLDLYKGVFCGERLRDLSIAEGLTGVTFSPDVSNPVGESFGSVQ
ncbi:hypothetical protein [Marinimicrobium agarilyticum]|uniref:hypothetical protein n=1 Tax=Marinimicrobium agarilyticum TaxID=306546 RepID=UPI0004866B10|nr:hypothetical protein [Marinimicrobium agarilyticum]